MSPTHPAASASAPRPAALAIALPATIVDPGLSPETVWAVAESIVRLARAFLAQEIVVYDSDVAALPPGHISRTAGLLTRLLQYHQAPKHIRGAIPDPHNDLHPYKNLPCPFDPAAHTFQVRPARGLAAVLTESAHPDGCK